MKHKTLLLTALIVMLLVPGTALGRGEATALPAGSHGPSAAAATANWEAAYWNNVDLSGQPVLVRSEPAIDYNWGTGSPGAPVNNDRFSARWQRSVELAAGTYRFSARSDDGMRVWVDGARIIDEWQDQLADTTTVDRQLSAGFHLFVVDYYDNLGDAEARLSWAPVGRDDPSGRLWRGEYYANRDLAGAPALVRDDAEIRFEWGYGSPAAGLPVDRFSARWTRKLALAAGVYRFTVTADDGVRLWVQDRLVVDAWHDQPATAYSAEVKVPDGGVPVRLEYFENAGEALVRLNWAPLGTAENWRGEYYANKELRGSPALVRDDAEIQFQWGSSAPGPGVPADGFSARWTRRLAFKPGSYRFTVTADDGVRLWVQDRLVVDAWRDQGATTYVADVAVTAAEVPLRLEYYENLGEALVRLSWAPVGAAQNWRGEYYANKDLSGTPALVRDDAEIQFNWGGAAPAPGLPANHFSVRWTRQLALPAGSYRFTVTADDGARLWVRDRLVIDAWRDQGATTYVADVALPGDGVPVKLEYYDHTVDAVIKLSWAPLGTVQNWRGEYYANRTLGGTPTLVCDDAQIQFRWGTGSPGPGLPNDNFSVRWTRQLPLEAGNYRFTVTVDDGVRLWVNNHLLVDAWRIQGPTTYSADIYVPGGGVPVRLEYYEATGGATALLSWAKR